MGPIHVAHLRSHDACAFLVGICRLRIRSQGEIVYKNLQMSQGVYFVTKGIAEGYAKIGDGRGGGGEEEKVKGIVSAGKFFGYSKFLAAFLEEDMAVRAFTPLYVSWSCLSRRVRHPPEPPKPATTSVKCRSSHV